LTGARTCPKKTFLSREEARSFARQLRSARRLRPYRCPDCSAWHLSSMSRSEHKRKAKERAGADGVGAAA